MMEIRTAAMADLDQLTAIEAACFPQAEAATREEFTARLTVYPNHFWLLEEDGKIIAFINGPAADEPLRRGHPAAGSHEAGPSGDSGGAARRRQL